MIEGSRDRRFMSEINVVPLVDVVLVLLIIFMITAPMLYRGIEIDLPQSSSNTIRATERIILTVSQDRHVYVNDKKVLIEDLERSLEEIKAQSPEATLYLQGDERVAYGAIIEVMDVVKQVGISQVGMVTEPVRDQ